MSPVTHLLTGWLLTFPNKPNLLTRREKALVVAASLIPDVDGLGLLPELLTRNSSHALPWFSQYHHSLHTLAFATYCTILTFLIVGPLDGSRNRPLHSGLTTVLVFVSFHMHLLCDLIGARGPDGYQWPIPYLKPFSNALQLSWQGQWALNGWQNIVFTGLLLMTTLWMAWKHATSPLELFSMPANHAFVQALRRRFPMEPGTLA